MFILIVKVQFLCQKNKALILSKLEYYEIFKVFENGHFLFGFDTVCFTEKKSYFYLY